MREKKQAFFLRMLLFNTALVLIMTILPQLVYHHYVRNEIVEQIHENNVWTVKQLQENIDEKVLKEMIQLISRNFSAINSNEALVYPMNHSIIGDTTKILAASSKIDDIMQNSGSVHTIDIYYMKSNLFFMGSNACFLDHTSCNLGFKQNWIDQMKDSENSVMWMISEEGDETVISYIRRLPFFVPGATSKATVGVNMRESSLQQIISDMQLAKDMQVIIYDGEGKVVSQGYASDEKKSSAELINAASLYNTLTGTKNFFNFSQSSNDYTGAVISSGYNDWQYVIVMPQANYYQSSLALTRYLFIIGVVMLLLNLVVAYGFTRKAYHPIGSAIANYREKIGDLNVRLELNMPIIRHMFIRNLLFAQYKHPQNVGEQERLLDIHFTKDRYCAFQIRLKRKNEEFQDDMLLDYQIIEQLQSTADWGTVYAILEEPHCIIGMVSYSQTEKLEEIIEGLCLRMKPLKEQDYILCLGAERSELKRVSESYSEALIMNEYCFMYPNKAVIKYEAAQIATRSSSKSSAKILDDIEDMVKSGNQKQLKFLVEQIVEAFKTGHYQVEYCRNYLMDVVSAIRRAIQSLGCDAEEWLGYDIRNKYKSIPDIECFRSWMEEVIQVISDKADERRQGIDKELERKIISFIKENEPRQVTLESLAEHVSMNANYLSKVFKNMTGQTFTEYMMAYKIKMAKQLLKNKITVLEISYQLGYNSTPHFIRLFKEAYGMTPKQYQKLYSKTGQKHHN